MFPEKHDYADLGSGNRKRQFRRYIPISIDVLAQLSDGTPIAAGKLRRVSSARNFPKLICTGAASI